MQVSRITTCTFFFLLLIASTYQSTYFSVAQVADKPQKPFVKEKFDQGLEKKIRDIINAGDERDYNVIIYVNKIAENGLDAKSVAKNNKDRLEDVLKRVHNARDIQQAKILSFVTATMSTKEIEKLADYDYVIRIGDGEKKMELELNVSRPSIFADGLSFNGSGIKVSVIDTAIRQFHTDMPSGTKIINQVTCSNTGCVNGVSAPTDPHGTRVAGIIGGLGIIDPNLRGIATGSLLLNAVHSTGGFNATSFGHALDWSLQNGAKVINVSQGFPIDLACGGDVENLMVDETVDEGALVVKSAGNRGPFSGTITDPGCSYNVITVGNIDDNGTTTRTDDIIHVSSSRGPTYDGRLKPEIVAPGEAINSTDLFVNYSDDLSGTSFAAPHVSGTAALVLQAHPEYSPLEVKAALLLGAEWKASVPINASAYETGNSADVTLNTFGFGYLNASNTLAFTNTGKNIIHDVIAENQIKKYSFSANQGEQVKVILSWLKHTVGNATAPVNATSSNLDFNITRSDNGAIVASSTSMKQNNEFAVFNAPVTGNYTITVSAPSVAPEIGSTEIFALASTHQITKVSLLVKEGTFTKTTVTGNQNVTGVGFKPKALLLFTTRQNSTGSTDIYNFAIGFSNGSSSRSIGVASDDNVATSNAGRAFGTQALRILSAGTPTVTAQANVTSFDPDGFTLNWATNDSTASIIHYVALGGEAITNAAVSSFVANTATGNQPVSGLGFKPDFLMFMHAANTTETGTATHGYISYGFTTFSDRGAVAVASEDARATKDTWRFQKTDRAIVALTESTGVIDAEADIVSMDPNGFTINWVNAPASADRVYYLALKGGQYDVGNFVKTTSAAPVTQTIATVEFQPSGLLLSSFNRASSTSSNPNNRLSFGATDGTMQSAIWAGDRDGVGNSITARSTTTSKVIRLATEQATGSSSTINAEANLASMNSNGFNMTWTTNDSTQTRIIYAAFGLMGGSNIIIVEETIPDNARDFNFTSGNFTSFLLDDDTDPMLPNTKIFGNLLPGTYNISQTPDANYTTTSSCSDGSLVSAIALGTDETVTCKFVNRIISGVATGDILVTDSSGTVTNLGLLFKVDPTTGVRTVVSDFNDTSQGPLGVNPSGVAVRAGDILVTDAGVGYSDIDSLFKVDPATGARTILSNFSNPSQGPTGLNPYAITVDASGNILVADIDAGTSSRGLLFKVDPATGVRTVLSDFSNATQGTLGQQPYGVTVDASGDILVANPRNGPELAFLFKVNPITGVRTVLSNFSDTSQGPTQESLIDVTVDASGGILVMDGQLLLKVDPITGVRTVLSDFSNATQGTLGFSPFGVTVDASGDILVTDMNAGGGSNLGLLFKVDPITGVRTVLSDFSDTSQGTLGADPSRAAVYSAP